MDSTDKQRFQIKGEWYELASYGEKFSDGSRQATVRRVCPCRYENEDKCCHEDCSICRPTPTQSDNSKQADPKVGDKVTLKGFGKDLDGKEATMKHQLQDKLDKILEPIELEYQGIEPMRPGDLYTVKERVLKLISKEVEAELQSIADVAYDDMHQTYDYNRLAEALFDRLKAQQDTSKGELDG